MRGRAASLMVIYKHITQTFYKFQSLARLFQRRIIDATYSSESEPTWMPEKIMIIAVPMPRPQELLAACQVGSTIWLVNCGFTRSLDSPSLCLACCMAICLPSSHAVIVVPRRAESCRLKGSLGDNAGKPRLMRCGTRDQYPCTTDGRKRIALRT
jgi:hypothetical protein